VSRFKRLTDAEARTLTRAELLASGPAPDHLRVFLRAVPSRSAQCICPGK
jgi:hypothetical protein